MTASMTMIADVEAGRKMSILMSREMPDVVQKVIKHNRTKTNQTIDEDSTIVVEVGS